MRRISATIAWVLACCVSMQVLTVRAEVTDARLSVFAHPTDAAALMALLGTAATSARAAAALRGEFTQRKYLHELPQPLVSSGEFLVARGLGAEWLTRKPFNSEVLLTPQALIQRGADGAPQRVDASRQPGLAAVSQVFDALFALDLNVLAQRFQLFGEKAEHGGWTLGLVPREPAFAQNIARIVVSGADQPQRITLYQGPSQSNGQNNGQNKGDRTEIDLTQVNALAALQAVDRKRFEQ